MWRKWKGSRSDHTFATTKDFMHGFLTAENAPGLRLGRWIGHGRLRFLLSFLIWRRGWIVVDLLLDLLNKALSWHARFLDLIRHELLNVIRRHSTQRISFSLDFFFLFSCWAERMWDLSLKGEGRDSLFCGDGVLKSGRGWGRNSGRWIKGSVNVWTRGPPLVAWRWYE